MIEAGIVMVHKVTREELKRIDTMTALEAVAYANRVSNRLKCSDCAHEDASQRLVLRGIAFWCLCMVLLYIALSGFFNAIISLFAFGLAVFLFIQQQRFESRQSSEERTEIDD